MAWHTIQETQKLTGKSRRTLYRDMAAGRLSWEPEGDSGRRLETSELIRVYGELKPLAQPEPEKTAHGDTGLGTHNTALILAELKALREEVAELRQAMRLIEHKPDLAQPDTPKSVPNDKPTPWWKRPLFTRQG
ncbi:entry exclusion protein 1 [Pseudomonas sp. FFUP_PS_473]|uniref:entry exclusion protein 1 n=1 Tax=Pseudomonas sp. FFUP_PS_473 TaxID=2060418 RepID=UPI002113C881|nr:entry exclusion protein 1 [Pseudomonas sp. FFUP_PS_473]